MLRLFPLLGGASAGAAILALTSTAVAGPLVPLPREVPATARERIEGVAGKATVSTHVDGAAFPGRQEVFEYLLDHPDFATHVTQALRLARYHIWKTSQGLAIDDGWGTIGTFEVVYAAPGTRVMYARGEYRQRLLPDIRGQAVVVLDYAATPLAGGRPAIATSITSYVKLDSSMLALAGKLASAAASAKAEKEAHRLVKVFARTSHAIEENPSGVLETLRARPGVPARELDEFRRLLNVPAAAVAR